MGVDSLSMSATSLLRIKWVIRTMSQTTATELLQAALKLDNPGAVRALLRDKLEQAGLGGLVRAGR